MKKIGILTFLLLLMSGLLFASGAKEQAATMESFEGVTLNLLGHTSKHTDVIYQVIIPQWEEKTGAKVVTSSIPSGEINKKLVTEFVSGSGAYDATQLSELPGQYRWLEPLKPYLDDAEKTAADYDFDDFLVNHVKNICSFEGTLYAIPFRSDVRWLYYRKDVFGNAGLKPAETWDQQIVNAKKLNNPPDMYGHGMHARQYNATSSVFSEMLWSHGGDYFNDKWEPTFQEQPGIDALKVYRELVDYMPPDKFTFGAYEVATAFLQGRIAQAHNWPFLAGLAVNPEESKVVGKWDAALMPHAPGHGSHTSFGGWAFGIPKDGKKKDAAWDLVQFMTTKKAEKEIILNGGEANPCRKSTFEDQDVKAKFFHFPIMFQAFENSRTTPKIPEWSEINTAIVLAMTEVATDKKSPEEALRVAADTARKIVKEAGYLK